MPTIIKSWPRRTKPPGISASKLKLPTTHGLAKDFEVRLSHQIFDVPEAQGKTARMPNRVLHAFRQK